MWRIDGAEMLQDKVIIVTGAARGIGREYCVQFAKLGALIIASDVKPCTDTVHEACQNGGRVIGFPADVGDSLSTMRLAQAAQNEFGRIDGLVNNAALYGALHGGRFEAIAEDEWDAAMAVNVKGVWNCCKAIVPTMRESGGGSIVNITSLAAIYGMPYALHYTASKAAVIGLTRGLARELGRDGIRVNSIAPSAVATEGTREFFGSKYEKALDTIKAGQSIQRNLEPIDLVGTVAWLLSDGSRFVTGQTISVDGGTVLL
jgi:NAD(P)-dependent dehydrogenase (short-subunit alcohol dehydrogenase family)